MVLAGASDKNDQSYYLNENALIAFEIGQTQGKEIEKLAHKYLNCEVEIKKDLNNLDRFIFITLV